MRELLDDKIDFTLKSIDGITKASPKPFLLTRINAGLGSATAETIWSRTAFYLKKPLVSGLVILLLIFANIMVIKSMNNKSEMDNLAKSATSQKYDFAINVSVLYDIENQEP